MLDITWICDGCGRRFEFLHYKEMGGVTPIPRPLKSVLYEEFCQKCVARMFNWGKESLRTPDTEHGALDAVVKES